MSMYPKLKEYDICFDCMKKYDKPHPFPSCPECRAKYKSGNTDYNCHNPFCSNLKKSKEYGLCTSCYNKAIKYQNETTDWNRRMSETYAKIEEAKKYAKTDK